MERARHEGIVLHGIAEHHQLGAAQAVAVGGALGGLLHDLAHQRDRVHVDARACGADVDGGADHVGGGQRLGNGANQPLVGLGHGLVHQRRIAADEVHAGLLGRGIQRKGQLLRVLDAAGNQRRRGHGDALVDDGHAELALDGLPHLHQILRLTGDAVVDPAAQQLLIIGDAVEQGDAHGDRAHVQLLVVDHLQGLHDVMGIKHDPASSVRCDASHQRFRFSECESAGPGARPGTQAPGTRRRNCSARRRCPRP